MKLEEGMYCRYNGIISKISWISQQKNEGLDNITEALFHLENDKVLRYPDDNFEVSFNIIDLIKEGDYVNGLRVEKSRYGELYTGYVYCGGVIQRTEEAYAIFIEDMDIEDIEDIMTKECFENNCYKVGD